MQAWLFSEHLLCCSYIIHMNTKNCSTFEWAGHQYLREDIHLHLKLTPGKDEWVKCPCASWCRTRSGNQEIVERGDQGIAVEILISALIIILDGSIVPLAMNVFPMQIKYIILPAAKQPMCPVLHLCRQEAYSWAPISTCFLFHHHTLHLINIQVENT